MTTSLALILMVQLVQIVLCQPTIIFPFNSQLPPVARLNKLFSYSFSLDTFAPSTNLSYSLGDHPAWLFIESAERRLYGTPHSKDIPSGSVVAQSVIIIATDSTGSTPMNATLMVSRNAPPSVQIPTYQQIQHIGDYSAPSSLLSYPSVPFTYSFKPNTFTESPNNLNYYAVSATKSPLPAWIKFDASSLTFSGETPPLESPDESPQAFNFMLIASDIPRFSAASVSFSIIVGNHKLSIREATIILNTTRQSSFRFTNLQSRIKLDGNPVKPTDLSISTEHLPDWLSLDNETLEIAGTPGQSAKSAQFTILLHDVFGDTLAISAVVNVAMSLFISTFRDINARPGEVLNVDLENYFRSPADTEVIGTTKTQNNWLRLEGLRLYGLVPESASGLLSIYIRAESRLSGITETHKLQVKFANTTGTSNSPTSSFQSPKSFRSPTLKITRFTQAATALTKIDPADSGQDTKKYILLATIIPTLAIAFGVLLSFCYFRGRRGHQTYLSGKHRLKTPPHLLNSSRSESRPSVPSFKRSFGIGMHREKWVFLPRDTNYTATTSPTLNSNEPGFRERMLKSRPDRYSEAGTNARPSWSTIPGNMAREPGHNSADYNSGITVPHQILSSPNLIADSRRTLVGDRLENQALALTNLSGGQVSPSTSCMPSDKTKKQKDTITPSIMKPRSEILASVGGAIPKYKSAIPTNNRMKLEPLPEDATESILELQRPGQAGLSSQQGLEYKVQLTSHSCGSSSWTQSVGTETSSWSSQNWRLISLPRSNAQSMSYWNLVEQAPFNHARPSPAATEARVSDPGHISWRKGTDGYVTAERSIHAEERDKREEVTKIPGTKEWIFDETFF